MKEMREPQMINRGVITVVPKQIFYSWVNSTTPDSPIKSTDFQEYNAYLFKEELEYHDPDTLVKRHWQYIFANELFGMYTDETAWPENQTFEMFKEWFDFYVGGLVLDLEDGPVIKE